MIKVKDSIVSQTFEVEILTPTHIGGASENHWQNGLDFIIKDDKTWILDFKELSKFIDSSQLAIILSRADTTQTLEKSLDAKKVQEASWKSFDANMNSLDIKRHIFNGFDGKPYIPGSSIKGAISSILLNYFYRNSTQVFQKNGKVSEQVLGNFENSVMRFFQFTDIHFTDTFLTNTKIFNLQKNDGKNWAGGWKHGKDKTDSTFKETGFTTIYESLKTFSRGNLMLSFKKGIIEQLYAEALKNNKIKLPPTHTAAWLTKNPTEQLCQIINTHTLSMLKKEIAFFENYQIDDNTGRVLSKLNDLKNKVERLQNSSKECILRLSAGSGFHSITGDWQYDDYYEVIGVWTEEDSRNKLCKKGDVGKQKYKSRKLAFEKDTKGGWIFQPMGFIKLTLLDEETILKRQQQEAIEKEFVQQRAIEEAKAEAERLERERIEKEEAKKPKMYEGAITKNLEVDAEVIESGKPNKVKIYVKGYEDKKIEMTESAPQPKGYVCRVAMVIEKGKIQRVRHLKPKQ
ncbi:type III-A CRISPR-associated RAMP protein Csm5 [Flectobacillus sp. BAB-3569]|uniref:type III-A CRISPR-associated RAMP protein Csm5 n=1 Tax=Flectobacillus sp. BAB-3569 TaxID=1509483 RepID=UPI000BA2E275|nr:type III-A CRISPR-associated RAMP protein Csm5 [Flectobacillus sp. BAB-3569]PAC26459.1 type III-A CRISPR-associated RAMP protein Csm5 [Flectobacillus sp. BAB-3569]